MSNDFVGNIKNKTTLYDLAAFAFSVFMFLKSLDSSSIIYPTIIKNFSMYFCIGSGLIAIISENNTISRVVTKFTKWCMIFACVILVSMIYAPNIDYSIQYALLPFLIQFALLFVLENIVLRKGFDWFANIFIMYGIVIITLSFVLYAPDLFSGHRFGYTRGINPNELMINLIIPITFLIYKAMNKKAKSQISWFFIILGVVIMLCSGSKKSLLAISIFLLIFIINAKSTQQRFKIILVVIIMLLLLIYAIFNIDFLYQSIGRRIELLLLAKKGLVDDQYTDEIRFRMRELALNMFLDHPILGNGAEAFREKSGYNTYSHNTYTEILCSYGIVGTILFFYFPIKNLIICIRNAIYRPELKNAIMICLLLDFFVLSWGCVFITDLFNMEIFMLLSVFMKDNSKGINKND